MHGYLLWSQRANRKWSISVHAAHDRQSYMLYIAGHALSGLFFLLFAHTFFIQIYHVKWLFELSLAGIFFEYLQAVVPGKGTTESAHAFAAYCMFITYAAVTIVSVFVLPLHTSTRLVAAPFLLAIPICGVYAHVKRNKFYFSQMIAIGSFCISMLVMAVGR